MFPHSQAETELLQLTANSCSPVPQSKAWMQLLVQETHLAAEHLSLGFGEEGGRVTGAHTLRAQEQEDRLPWQCLSGSLIYRSLLHTCWVSTC